MSEMDIHKLTGAYAMDALDELERARFEQHLADVRGLPGRGRRAPRDGGAAVRDRRGHAAGVAARLRARRHLPGPSARPRGDRLPVAPRRPPGSAGAGLGALSGRGGARAHRRGRRRGAQPWAPSDDVERLTAAEQVLQAPDAQEVSVDLGEAGQGDHHPVEVPRPRRDHHRGHGLAPRRARSTSCGSVDGDEFVSAGLMPDDARPDGRPRRVRLRGRRGRHHGRARRWLQAAHQRPDRPLRPVRGGMTRAAPRRDRRRRLRRRGADRGLDRLAHRPRDPLRGRRPARRPRRHPPRRDPRRRAGHRHRLHRPQPPDLPHPAAALRRARASRPSPRRCRCRSATPAPVSSTPVRSAPAACSPSAPRSARATTGGCCWRSRASTAGRRPCSPTAGVIRIGTYRCGFA